MTGASKGAGVLIVCLVTAAGAGEWKSAVEPHPFRFPEDHAAHENYRIEWWYYTGNLETRDGRRFGYQLTFFRTGVVREPENPSRWTIRPLEGGALKYQCLCYALSVMHFLGHTAMQASHKVHLSVSITARLSFT